MSINRLIDTHSKNYKYLDEEDEIEFMKRWEKVMKNIENDPELLELYEKQLDKMEQDEFREVMEDDDDLWPDVSTRFMSY